MESILSHLKMISMIDICWPKVRIRIYTNNPVCLRFLKKLYYDIWINLNQNQRLNSVNSYKSLIRHFRLSVALATNQNEEFIQYCYVWWRTTQETFIKSSVKIPAVS